MEKMQDEALETALAQREGWERKDQKWMVKKFRFQSFKQAVSFVNRVADVAEELNHHPMIALDFKLVTISLTSWKSAGITDLDFEEADLIDRAFQSMGNEQQNIGNE